LINLAAIHLARCNPRKKELSFDLESLATVTVKLLYVKTKEALLRDNSERWLAV
jgi:hypothetical protein